MTRKNNWRISLILTAMSLAFVLPALGWSGQSSTNYQIKKSVLSCGGSLTTSAGYKKNSTLGQSSPIGLSTGVGYKNYQGFWNPGMVVATLTATGLQTMMKPIFMEPVPQTRTPTLTVLTITLKR